MAGRKLTPSKIYRAIKAKAFQLGGNSVSRQEAQERMKLCSSCPKLKEPETALEHAALALSGGEYVCDVCGCGINLITTTRDDLLDQEDAEQSQQRPDFCWYPTDNYEQTT